MFQKGSATGREGSAVDWCGLVEMRCSEENEARERWRRAVQGDQERAREGTACNKRQALFCLERAVVDYMKPYSTKMD